MASDPLTDADVRHFSRRLKAEKAKLDAELVRLTGSLDDVRASRGDGGADDEHDPEGPTLSSEWSRISGVHTELAAKSEAIHKALIRVTDGTYGTCSLCGQLIGRERLEARPAAELCIDCARKLERRH
jgi:RNA polymerase-binding transcription factor DksA